MSLRLRPHHVLCLQFFEGKGYSEAFVRHMIELTAQLADDPAVTLTEGCDAVCAACPHNCGGVCDTAEKTASFDRRALGYLGLSVGDSMPWSVLRDAARERMIAAGRLSEVCCGCQWLYICNR